jgi:hypothetical protein
MAIIHVIIPVHTEYIPVHTGMYHFLHYVPVLLSTYWYISVCTRTLIAYNQSRLQKSAKWGVRMYAEYAEYEHVTILRIPNRCCVFFCVFSIFFCVFCVFFCVICVQKGGCSYSAYFFAYSAYFFPYSAHFYAYYVH